MNDVVTYVILEDSIKTSGVNIEDIKDKAFKIDGKSGELMLNFIPQDSMNGFFEFKVEARDSAYHTDQTTIKVFIVAESNRIKFMFLNSASDVVKNVESNQIAAILSRFYGYDCNVDDVLTSELNGIAQETLTDIRVHFLENNEAVEASIIQALVRIIF